LPTDEHDAGELRQFAPSRKSTPIVDDPMLVWPVDVI
jgi:hypothetical protein